MIPQAQEIIISCFSNIRKATAKDITLQYFIDTLTGKRPNKYAEAIAQLRKIDKGTDRETYDRIKQNLPAVTISCRCEEGKTHGHYVGGHTGVFAIDLDAADNPHIDVADWPALRDLIGGCCEWCYLVALSAGGKGIFILAAVDPDEEQSRTWEQLKSFFADKMGLKIDKSCGNINRLRFLSYDAQAIVKRPQTHFNAFLSHANKKVGNLYTETKREPQRANKRAFLNLGEEAGRVEAAVALWVRKQIALNDYTDWVRAAMALQGVRGGFDAFNAISRFGKGYSEAKCRKKFAACANSPRVGVGSFFYLCRDYGITAEEITQEYNRLYAPMGAANVAPQPKQQPQKQTEAEQPQGVDWSDGAWMYYYTLTEAEKRLIEQVREEDEEEAYLMMQMLPQCPPRPPY